MGKRMFCFAFLLLALSQMSFNTIEAVSFEDLVYTGEDSVLIIVEVMPEYPGGEKAMVKFISANTKYPKEAKEKEIEGRTIVSFIVEKDGSLSDIKAIGKKSHELLDREAVRVVSVMPKWRPGNQKGSPVRVKVAIPFDFKLTDAK